MKAIEWKWINLEIETLDIPRYFERCNIPMQKLEIDEDSGFLRIVVEDDVCLDYGLKR